MNTCLLRVGWVIGPNQRELNDIRFPIWGNDYLSFYVISRDMQFILSRHMRDNINENS